MSGRDGLHRFLFDRFPVRGELVCLDEAWSSVLARQSYPDEIRAILGQALAASALLASTLKFDGTLSLQLQGSGALKLLLVQCTSKLKLRGIAKWSGDAAGAGLADLAGHGRLAITIECGPDGERYQSIVPLQGATLARCLEAYFVNSEQLPTRLRLAADGTAAAGLLLQKIPAARSAGGDDDDAWTRVQLLTDTLTDAELLAGVNRKLLRKLFHEEDLRVFRPSRLAFHCTCSLNRIETMLRSLGAAEVRDILRERDRVNVRCEFCNKDYELDKVDAETLFSTDAPLPDAGTLH